MANRVTGLAKTHLDNALAATTINLIRLDAWLNDTPLGKTRTSHLAALDPRPGRLITQVLIYAFPNRVLNGRVSTPNNR